MTSSSPRTLVVGAGPAALALATVLACHGLAGDVEVVDPSGRWLTAWDRRFAAQRISHLRSPAVHHPHPDPFALLAVTPREELAASGGTKLPSSRSFTRFCQQLVARHGFDDVLTPAAAVRLHVDRDGAPTVHLADGSMRRPDRTVLATNARRPALPPAVHHLVGTDPRVCCGDAARVDDAAPDNRLVVVGGGLSAGHLAVGAAERGAHVTLVTRRRLTVRRFDTHPSWLGPAKRHRFETEPDPQVRRRTIDAARGGGSVPHRMRRRLADCVEAGSLRLLERVTLDRVAADDAALHLRLSSGESLVADQLWLATGGAVDVASDRLCRPLVALGRTPLADGLPDLAPDLSWPGTRVHLVGAAASLVLGPTAGNLVGQRRAALRVAASMRGDDPTAADRIALGTAACPVGAPG